MYINDKKIYNQGVYEQVVPDKNISKPYKVVLI